MSVRSNVSFIETEVPRPKCRFDERFNIGCAKECHFVNLQCRQRWKIRQNGISVSVKVTFVKDFGREKPWNLGGAIGLVHKSHNAPVPYPTMHHSVQTCAHFYSECCIVGYETAALWDLSDWSTPSSMSKGGVYGAGQQFWRRSTYHTLKSRKDTMGCLRGQIIISVAFYSTTICVLCVSFIHLCFRMKSICELQYRSVFGEPILRYSCKKKSLKWRHNERDGVPNHQPHDCLLSHLFRRRSKKTTKLRVTGLCEGIHWWPVNSPDKGPVTQKMFPFDDVIMSWWCNKGWM